MSSVEVTCDVNQPWEYAQTIDLTKCFSVREGIGIGRVLDGTQEGSSTVMIFIPLPDGRTAVGEITMNTFLRAATIFQEAEDAGKLKKRGKRKN